MEIYRTRPLMRRLCAVPAELVVKVAIDTARYEIGIDVSDVDLAAVGLIPQGFHAEWSYSISPR